MDAVPGLVPSEPHLFSALSQSLKPRLGLVGELLGGLGGLLGGVAVEPVAEPLLAGVNLKTVEECGAV